MADAVVQLLSAARDVAARSPYQRAIVPKLIELADEIMRFGDTALQDEFIAMAQAADFFLLSPTSPLYLPYISPRPPPYLPHISATSHQAADFFLFSLRAQLKAFMAEVKRALDIGRYREILGARARVRVPSP